MEYSILSATALTRILSVSVHASSVNTVRFLIVIYQNGSPSTQVFVSNQLKSDKEWSACFWELLNISISITKHSWKEPQIKFWISSSLSKALWRKRWDLSFVRRDHETSVRIWRRWDSGRWISSEMFIFVRLRTQSVTINVETSKSAIRRCKREWRAVSAVLSARWAGFRGTFPPFTITKKPIEAERKVCVIKSSGKLTLRIVLARRLIWGTQGNSVFHWHDLLSSSLLVILSLRSYGAFRPLYYEWKSYNSEFPEGCRTATCRSCKFVTLSFMV